MWPALIILAASAFLKAKANHDATKRSEAFRSSMEAYQRTKAAEGEAATQALVGKQTPKERETELSQVTADRTQSLKDTVGAAQAFQASPIAGKLSSDYDRAQESSANTSSARLKRAIEQLATMGAPGEQQQKFGLRFGKAAGTVDSTNRASESVGRGYLTDIGNVRPNPFLSTVGDIGMAVGGGMLGGGAGAAAGAQPNLVSPNNAEWGGLDAGPGAYSVSKANPSFLSRVRNGFSIWGR